MLGHRTLTLQDYSTILKRRWWIIAIPAIIFPIVGYGITFFVPPEYLSQTLVLVEQQKVPESYVKAVVTEDLSARAASPAGTTDFLKGQLADAKAKLDEQDEKLRKFQQTYVGKLPGAEASNINMLTTLNTQLDATTQALARLEQNKSYVESMAALQQQQNQASGEHGGATPQGR